MTTVSEALERRTSIRAFLDTPVDLAVVRAILETARRAPSGGNVQPWRVDVVSGAARDRLVADVTSNIAAGLSEEAEVQVYPAELWEPHRTYRFNVGEEMYALLGIGREDRAGRRARMVENFRFFGAPVGLFFSLDRRAGPPQWGDVGMLMQSVMLLAIEYGLDSCAQEAWCFWPDTVRRHLGLDDNMLVFSGMALGHRDPDAPVNQLRSSRAAVEEFVHFHD